MEFGITVDIKKNKNKQSHHLTISELKHNCVYRKKMYPSCKSYTDSYLYFLIPILDEEDEIIDEIVCKVRECSQPLYYKTKDFVHSKFIEVNNIDSINIKMYKRHK